VNPAGTVDQKTNIVSREDDYVELRDDTLVPGRFLKNEKYPQMVRPIEGQADI
jgi:hypothetical protein